MFGISYLPPTEMGSEDMSSDPAFQVRFASALTADCQYVALELKVRKDDKELYYDIHQDVTLRRKPFPFFNHMADFYAAIKLHGDTPETLRDKILEKMRTNPDTYELDNEEKNVVIAVNDHKYPIRIAGLVEYLDDLASI